MVCKDIAQNVSRNRRNPKPHGGRFSSRVSKRRPSCVFVIIHSLNGENAWVISSDKSRLQPLTQDKLIVTKRDIWHRNVCRCV
jgi:hypothetical protein